MLRLRHSSLLPAVFLVLAVCYSSSFATPPGLLSFQGRLTDPAGSPLNGTYTLTFVIYNVPNGGSPLWTETQTAVQVSDGLFQVNLGSVIGLSDAIFNDSSRYLGVTVGAGAELAPRTRLTSTAFSFRTQSVDGASGGTIRGGLFVVGNEYLTQELSATGFVGGFGLYGFNGTNPSPDNIGVKGVANGGDWNVGVLGMASDAATGSANSAGVYGVSAGIYGGTIWAGYFDGWTNVAGNFYASAKFFRIDDPKHPADRMLTHSCVESDEYKNIYDGIVTTDAAGNATVTLPDWFDALNREFRYQLTCIGQFAQAIVVSEINNNQFAIQTDKPMVRVSWQVTGVRKDPYANAHPITIEQDKPVGMKGKYLNPVEYGVSEELGVDYAARKFAEKQQAEAAARRSVSGSASSR